MNYRKKAVLLAVALLGFHLGIYAQSLSLKMQNVSVKKAMTELQAKSGYSFVYIAGDVDTDRKVSVDADQLQEAIKQILQGQQVTYEIQGKNVVVRKKTSQSNAPKQERKVSGTVKDANGEPIIGANVTVKGDSSIGTITDIDGRFSLDVPAGAVLQVTYIGFASQDVEVGNKSELAIALKEDTEMLDEVVVVGYGTSRKKDITGSIASVKSENLNMVSSSSINQMLQGKVTGMNISQSSAQPGAGMSVNIRGGGSPLYIIDGVLLQNNSTADPGIESGSYGYKPGVDRDPLNGINPNDIESIEVLKDASAAAIYGASAANGVVLITTKKGETGKVNVSYNSVFTAQLAKDYPEVLNAHDFREQTNLWTKEYYLYSHGMGVYGDNPIDYSEYVPIFDDVDGYKANTDWMKEVMRQGYVVDQNVSVSGGSEKTKYYMSYNFYKNQGMLINSDLRRHNIRLNLDQTFSKIFKAGVKINYSNVKANSTSCGEGSNGDNMVQSALIYAPDLPIKDENGRYTQSYNKLRNNPKAYEDLKDETITERVFIAPSFELKLFDGLSLHGTGGYDSQSSTRKFYVPTSASIVNVLEGQASLGYAKTMNLNAEAFLNYEKTFGDNHRISAVFGAGYYKTSSNGFRLLAVGFFTDTFGPDNVGIANDKEKEKVHSWREERVKLSQFMRLNYGFKDKYIVTFTARRDGSSYFAANHKWGFFPGVSLAWRVIEEDFLKDKTPFSDLKLRVGYGAVGNENILGTNSQTLYKSGYDYLLGNSVHTGLALVQIENPNLKWETDYTLNIGLDYGFLNQRINGTLEYFRKTATDLLDFQQLPSNNAVGRVAANIGETKYEGFEFSFKSDNLSNKDLKWETSLNVSYVKGNWEKRNPEVELAEYIGEKDNIGTIYGWKTDGIITSKEDIPSYMPNAVVGNIKYVDINGDNVLNSEDVVKLGNEIPSWSVGLGNTFRYKNFDLNFYFYGAFGHKKWRGQVPNITAIGNVGAAPENTYSTIKTEVWNSQTGMGWMPGVASNVYDGSNPTGNNDFYLMKGNYVKLKNITVGYTLPRNVFTKSRFIQGARFFVDAQNVATFTKYKGFDPELGTDNPYPQALSLSFGFNLNF